VRWRIAIAGRQAERRGEGYWVRAWWLFSSFHSLSVSINWRLLGRQIMESDGLGRMRRLARWEWRVEMWGWGPG
jgi:hypothetical protein